MAEIGQHIQLSEMAPRISNTDSVTLHDASDEHESPVDSQQSNDDSSSTSNESTTQDPASNEEPSGGPSATIRLWQRAIAFSKKVTLVDILTLCGFPLLILGAWATIKTIRVAEWTQWKDSFEWCENHDWTYAGCAPLRDDHLKIPAGPSAIKRFITVPNIGGSNATFLSASSGMQVMNILVGTFYLLVVIVFDLIRRFSKSRIVFKGARAGSSVYPITGDFEMPFLLSRLNYLEEELETVRAEASRAVEEQSKLRKQLVATNARTAASLAELKGKFMTSKDEMKKAFTEMQVEAKEVREMALRGLNDTKQTGLSTALGTGNPQDIQRDERSKRGTYHKGIRKRLPDIREREHSGLVW